MFTDFIEWPPRASVHLVRPVRLVHPDRPDLRRSPLCGHVRGEEV